MADGVLVVAVGASRSGKTAWVKRELARQPAVLVWDVEGQYAADGFFKVETPKALVAALRNPALSRVAYVPPSLTHFEFFCKSAWVWLRGPGHKALVVEELADVTSPAKAPAGWGIIVRRGLKYDCDIYAITQRPAESDKSIMGNASIIHCCGLQRAGDRKYMAAEMDLNLQDLATLDRSRLEFIHKDMRTGEAVRDTLKW